MPADTTTTGAGQKSMYVVFNPAGGTARPEALLKALEKHLGNSGWRYEVYQITGTEDLPAVVRRAAEQGYGIVVAAGGDGTASAAVNGLVGTGASLGIVPLGTGNMLARDLGIPVDIDQACAVLAGEHDTLRIDLMRAGDRHFVLNVTAGLTAVAMRDTSKARKKYLGLVGYLVTGVVAFFFGFRPGRVSLEVDGRKLQARAAEVLIVNGSNPLRASPASAGVVPALADGRVGVYILRARTLLDYAVIGWAFLRGKQRLDPRVRYLSAAVSVGLSARPQLALQADGDSIGETPVQVWVVPQALTVIVPRHGNQAGPTAS